MIHLQRFSAFTQKYPGWIFTTGLSLSAAVDILITACLCYFLHQMRRRTASTTMTHVVNTLTLYTLENGFFTCITTTASLISWLAMPQNLVFMGLHFIIGKLYVNSLLFSLNTQKELREMRTEKPEWEASQRVLPLNGYIDTAPRTVSDPYSSTYLTTSGEAYHPAFKSIPPGLPTHLEVSVERTVTRSSDEPIESRMDAYGLRPATRSRPNSLQYALEPWRSLP